MTLQEFKQSVEAKVLKYLFKNVSYIALSESKIKKEHFSFYSDVYRFVIFYYHKFGGIVDSVAALDVAKARQIDKNVLVHVNDFLANIDNIQIDDSESAFLAEADTLLSLYKKSELIALAQNITDFNIPAAPIQKVAQLEEIIAKKITEISTDLSLIRKSGSLAESADDQLRNYVELRDHPEIIDYIPSGLSTIDLLEGGFRKSELIYVIGRKGAGKSILMLNFGLAAANANKNVLLFSLEISKEDYERRLAACSANILSNGLKRGTLDNEEYERYKKYLKNLKEHRTMDNKPMGNFVIVDVPSQITPSFIEAQLIFEQNKRNIKFDEVIVDYAGIMAPNIAVVEKRHAQGAIALSLKQIARKYDCVVISGAQMSRQGKNEIANKDGRADSSHIAESDQVADHIDWGIAIRLGKDPSSGIIESFKTRDAAPFIISFSPEYARMRIVPICDVQNAPKVNPQTVGHDHGVVEEEWTNIDNKYAGTQLL